ncbi:non-ribosomal peptide synthetase [Mycobacterium sp. C31M]
MAVAATTSETVRAEVAELLGIGADSLDPNADLIASGLDSIRMMSLSGRWRKQGIEVGFAALAAEPTVAAWQALVAEHAPAPAATDDAVLESIGDDPDAPFSLAPIAHAMWVGRHGEQELGGVAAHLYVEFDGAGVDPERLQRAATKLVARHPMLRQEILPDGTQRISDRGLPVAVYDLRDAADAEQRLEQIRDDKSHQLMDDEVLQISLSLLADGRTRLHVDMDMQAADAVSYRNFMADLAAFYRGAELPDLQYTYREYRNRLTALTPPPSETDRQWWAERIPDLPEPPALPLVPRAEQANPLRNVRLWHIFDVPTRDALFAAAHRRGVTPAMAVAAAYANALARWSSDSRFLLNLPMFGREPYHPDVDKLVGCFTSSLMLDIDLAETNSAASRARAVQEVLHSTAAHSSVSGLSVLRDMSRHRGTQTLATIVYTSALGLGDLFAGDVTDQFGEPVWTISQGPQVLIDAQATPLANGLMINWDVRVEAFPPGVPEAMFAYEVAELQRLADDDAAWDAVDPPALSEASRNVRAAVNATTAPPSGDNLVDGFFRNAEATPDAVAVISGAGELSYGELRGRVLAVAGAVQARGVGRGDVVAVLGPKGAEQIPALLGILTAGAAYLPIGIDQPVDRATRILATAGVKFALITGTDTPAVVGEAGIDFLHVGEAQSATTDFRAVAGTPEDLAYVLFTSGSTGEPKGVELSHDTVMNTLEFLYRHFDIGSDARALALSHLESDMSVPDVFGTLRVGGAIVMVDEDQRRDPDTWARLIETHRVSVVNFIPGWLEMLTEVPGDLSSLRVVLAGGDWVRPDMVRALRKRAPQMRFAGLGGATETAVHGTIFEIGPDAGDDLGIPASAASVPYGVPFANNACRVVSPAGEDCPDWVPGELWFTGRGIASGYRGRPDLTAEKFVEYDGRTWYRTGDLARYWPDGTLEFIGRTDHRVKISGYRIELGEVEAALARVPGVGAAVAAVVTAGSRDVLGALVRVDEPGMDAAAVTAALVELVPDHMIPQLIVVGDRIPFTVGGKIDRKAVTLLLSEADLPAERGYRAPSTALQKAVARIMAELLGRDDVGIDDDFFALGGDSVMATQVVAHVRDWLDTPTIMVPDVFATRTVAALAERLTEREADVQRLELVAELYLEVADMDEADVESQLHTAGQS